MAAAGRTASDARQSITAVTGVTWHKLTLINGWTSSQNVYGTGNPRYAISGGVAYLSGSLHAGTSTSFAVLPKAARPAHWLYMTVYTNGGTHGTLLIKSDGEMAAYSAPSANATNYTSLAGLSYPTASITQHKLALMNGWTSGQTPYGTGAPSYAIKNSIVYLSGSLKGGTSDGFAFLPASALRAQHIYRGVYTFDSTFGEVYISTTGYMVTFYNGNAKAFTSLAGISFPVSAVTQHKVTLLNGWKSAQTPSDTDDLTYAIKGGVVYLSGGIKLPSGTNSRCAARLAPHPRPSGAPTSRAWRELSCSGRPGGRRPFEHGLGNKVVRDGPRLARHGVEFVAEDSRKRVQ
jgi:hypothetical protein